jgi:hypothetical protein
LKLSKMSITKNVLLWLYFSKSFNLCYCVWLCWLCLIVWFTLTLNVRHLKISKIKYQKIKVRVNHTIKRLKTASVFFLRPKAVFFWSYDTTQRILNKFIEELFCRMYGLAVNLSMSTWCQPLTPSKTILIR